MLLKFTGTLSSPKLTLQAVGDAWEMNEIVSFIFTGSTPNQLRQRFSGQGGGGQTTATDTVAKAVTGYGVGDLISDPVRKALGLDQATVEFSTGSVDARFCKRLTRYFKTCGSGELGFAGSSRVEQRLELKVSDWISGAARVEYLNQNVGTFQESNTRWKLELKIQIPLGH